MSQLTTVNIAARYLAAVELCGRGILETGLLALDPAAGLGVLLGDTGAGLVD